MAKTAHYHTKFEEECFYHIYNRSVDKKPMFKNEGNYVYFLKQYDKYLSAVVDTYAYCLLGNHFHLLVRVLDLTTFRDQNLTTFQKLSNLSTHEIVSHQFRKFFQSYSMAFNKQQERTGTLFQTPFKRSLISTDSYFTQIVFYIHANPQKHGFTEDFKTWEWSSYNRILIEKPSKLKKGEVIQWFGDLAGFKQYHTQPIALDENIDLDE
ncbi:MAG: transposase [Cytophagales bacterium]